MWIALAATGPAEWDHPIATYFMITIILSIAGWTGLARVVRGKLLQLRVEDYVLAAKIVANADLDLTLAMARPRSASSASGTLRRESTEMAKVPVSMKDTGAVMVGTGLHHDVGRGYGKTSCPRRTGEFVRRVPDLRRQRKLDEVALDVTQHVPLMTGSSAVPQLRSDDRTPCGAPRSQQCRHSLADLTISVSPQAVDPRRGIYQRHGVSRSSLSSAGEMRLSQVPRCRTRAAIRARRLKSTTAVRIASRLVLAPVISIASFNIVSGISIEVFMLP